MGKKTAENSKKVAGQARKADAAAAKKAQEESQKQQAEAEEWEEGSKKANAKKLAEQEKKAKAAQAKKEKEEALAEEEASVKTNKQSKQERNKFKKGNLDDFLGGGKSELNASGIDDALDALELATGTDKNATLDRHPERRFKAAYAAYEARRLPEMKQEYSGLRQNQMKQLIHKEFEKSPENPFNQVTVSYNASQEEQADTKAKLREAKENRLARNK